MTPALDFLLQIDLVCFWSFNI